MDIIYVSIADARAGRSWNETTSPSWIRQQEIERENGVAATCMGFRITAVVKSKGVMEIEGIVEEEKIIPCFDLKLFEFSRNSWSPVIFEHLESVNIYMLYRCVYIIADLILQIKLKWFFESNEQEFWAEMMWVCNYGFG